ncbi:MAG: hypothetical protein GX061_02490 [Eubacteriaceae bacterium]|jgi:outer membrane protein assembly factor BamE (lipoprotein component of BamABCDE complex)|nr:hypothetical protein [Eubacteriaceae bacterium]
MKKNRKKIGIIIAVAAIAVLAVYALCRFLPKEENENIYLTKEVFLDREIYLNLKIIKGKVVSYSDERVLLICAVDTGYNNTRYFYISSKTMFVDERTEELLKSKTVGIYVTVISEYTENDISDYVNDPFPATHVAVLPNPEENPPEEEAD